MLVSGNFIDDHGDRSVTRDVASCAEAVHGDVERNHQCLVVLRKAEQRLKYAERCHNRSAGHTGCRHHRHAQHADETCHLSRFKGNPLRQHQGYGASHNLQDAAREMNRGAEGNDEAADAFAHSVFQRAAEGEGNRCGGRLSAQSGEIGGHHVPQQSQRIAAVERTSHRELKDEQEHVHDENHADDFGEDEQNVEDLPAVAHVEKDAEDVDWQKRKNHLLNREDDDAFKLFCRLSQRRRLLGGNAQSEGESEHEGCHDGERLGNRDGEVGEGRRVLADVFQSHRRANEMGQREGADTIGEKARDECGDIGKADRQQQHPPGAGTALCFHIDDGGRDETQNDERNEETEELAEEPVESDEETNRNVGRKKPEQNAQSDGDENAGQESNGGKFHGSLWRVMGKTCFPKRKIRVRREQVLTPGCALYL